MPWKSERSGRIYSDAVEIDGLLYVDILQLAEKDHVKPENSKGIAWGRVGSFPEYYMSEVDFPKQENK